MPNTSDRPRLSPQAASDAGWAEGEAISQVFQVLQPPWNHLLSSLASLPGVPSTAAGSPTWLPVPASLQRASSPCTGMPYNLSPLQVPTSLGRSRWTPVSISRLVPATAIVEHPQPVRLPHAPQLGHDPGP